MKHETFPTKPALTLEQYRNRLLEDHEGEMDENFEFRTKPTIFALRNEFMKTIGNALDEWVEDNADLGGEDFHGLVLDAVEEWLNEVQDSAAIAEAGGLK